MQRNQWMSSFVRATNGWDRENSMRISGDWQRKWMASCLVIFLAMPFGEAATTRQQAIVPGQQAAARSSTQTQPQSSDSTNNKPVGDIVEPEGSPTIDHNQQSGTPPPAPEQQQNSTSQPVGAAAAPYEATTGVAASRPAGAVIAPAKQRRARSFLIRVGLLVGAGVAIGTVMALSSASPSRPH